MHDIRLRELAVALQEWPQDSFEVGLELGAGDGYQSRLLTRWVRHLIVTDYYDDRLPADSADRIEYLRLDIADVRTFLAPGSFDLVFASHVLNCVPDPERALEDICTVLTEGGIAVFALPNRFFKVASVLAKVPSHLLNLTQLFGCGGGLAAIRTRVRSYREMTNDEYHASVFPRSSPHMHRHKKSLAYYLLLGDPIGAYESHWTEFLESSRIRWTNRLERAGFRVIAVRKGPATTGHGLGLRRLRGLVEACGLGSSFIYICTRQEAARPHVTEEKSLGCRRQREPSDDLTHIPGR